MGADFCAIPQPSLYADVTMLEIRVFPDPSSLSLLYPVLLLAQSASPKAALLLLILFFPFLKTS